MMLKISNLYSGYKKNDPILKNINLTINNGEVLLLVGRNGAGKSTLAKALINNVPYMEGEISFKDKTLFNSEKKINVSTHNIINNGIGYFLQGGRVFPQLTVKENIFIASNKSDFNNSNYFNTLKNEFGFLINNWNEKATYLSLGQKHLLALAMVLSKEPKFLILDEPTAGLDNKNIRVVIDIINKLKNETGLSIFLIEHRTEEIRSLADRRVEIDDGEIKI